MITEFCKFSYLRLVSEVTRYVRVEDDAGGAIIVLLNVPSVPE